MKPESLMRRSIITRFIGNKMLWEKHPEDMATLKKAYDEHRTDDEDIQGIASAMYGVKNNLGYNYRYQHYEEDKCERLLKKVKDYEQEYYDEVFNDDPKRGTDAKLKEMRRKGAILRDEYNRTAEAAGIDPLPEIKPFEESWSPRHGYGRNPRRKF